MATALNGDGEDGDAMVKMTAYRYAKQSDTEAGQTKTCINDWYTCVESLADNGVKKQLIMHCSIPTIVNNSSNGVDISKHRAAPPGILSLKALQCILTASPFERSRDDVGDDEDDDGMGGAKNHNQQSASLYEEEIFHARKVPGHPIQQIKRNARVKKGLKRSRYQKLEPMPRQLPVRSSQTNTTNSSNDNSTTEKSRMIPQPTQQIVHHLRGNLQENDTQYRTTNGKVRQEIEWIHGHFPVLKLATAKCSRKLRMELFIRTLGHISRAEMRNAWYHWNWTITAAKQMEFMRLGASKWIIERFEAISMSHLIESFIRWQKWMDECRVQETLAATIIIQNFVRACKQRRSYKASAKSAALALALVRMHTSATTIQHAYIRYRHISCLKKCLHRVKQIQRQVRRHQERQKMTLRNQAVTQIQRLAKHFLINHYRQYLAVVSSTVNRSHCARTIQHHWRLYQTWKNERLPRETVEYVVDQVEFLAAVTAIQTHLRGYQCRFRLQKKQKSATRIQKWWHRVQCRHKARNERRMLHVRRHLAACCLQCTFLRNRERKQLRRVLQQSTQPLYLRARNNQDPMFRDQFRVYIAKSAVSVIQFAWRKHKRYQEWKKQQTRAAIALQRFIRSALRHYKWHFISVMVLEKERQQLRNNAIERIQRWWVAIKRKQKEDADTNAAQVIGQLAVMLAAALCLQRCYHRRKDRWRMAARFVMLVERPRYVNASRRIGHCWRRYRQRKADEASHHDFILVQHRLQEQLHQNNAAVCIQKTFHRWIDRRNGKLLLKKYKILKRQELKMKQQRLVIHRYLVEQDDIRAKKQQNMPVKAISPTTRTSTDTINVDEAGRRAQEVPIATMQQAAGNQNDSADTAAMTDNSNVNQGDEVVQYWSEEYQQAYLYNLRTGVSTWIE